MSLKGDTEDLVALVASVGVINNDIDINQKRRSDYNLPSIKV